MNQADSLARHTLDTLPFNVAVLDGEGTICFTNRAWREFGGAGPTEGADMVGVNYFEATDTEGDEHARAALAGLQEVIEGDRDLFTLEYPCHSPDERRWFLMRASPLSGHDEGRVVVAHINITDRKLAELRAQRQHRELDRLTDRLHGLVGDVMEAVLQARTREEIEDTVCAALAGVSLYADAWVAHADRRTEELVPAAWGDTIAVEGTNIDLGDASDPTARAYATGETVAATIRANEGFAAVHESALEGTEAGVVALPLSYGETRYGVLTVYAADPGAIDDRELAVLEVLARVTATAINAVEGRRILATDDVVELDLAVDAAATVYGELADSLSCPLAHEATLSGDDGVRMLFVAEGTTADAVEAAAADHPRVTSVSVLDAEAGAVLVELVVPEPPLVSMAADRGGETTGLRADPDEVTLTVEFPAGTDTRAVLDDLGERYPSIDLRARRERERTDRTRQELVAGVQASLTDRQRLALQKAYLGGFFDWPRAVSGEELAASMDISPSTYHQHLRAAEGKVFAALFE